MKKILLQTMPHTGTHTVHYLFGVLGGIEVVWHHWEKNCIPDIEIAMGLNWDDFVFVRTHRDALETLKSYQGRAVNDLAGAQYYVDCCEVFQKYSRHFPTAPIIMDLSNKVQMTFAANKIFFRCGVIPPQEAIEYMKTWKRIGSQHDEEPPAKAIKQSIHKGKVSTWHTN